MSLHKLSAGEGYTYLTRQVAAADRSERTRVALADYYSEHGERPGVWMGSGLAGVVGVEPGQVVSEAQLEALFGSGLHPDAEAITARLRAEGADAATIRASTRLGRPFPVHTAPASEYLVALRAAYRDWNRTHGRHLEAAVPEAVRQELRTQIGKDEFAAEYGRAPDARELAAFITRSSRQPQQAVAGYDLTFSPVKSVSALWAVAPRPVAEQIAACHNEAVANVLAWLEAEVAHTRLGAGGVRQVDVTGLIATAFTHRNSRAGDPDLHTHVAVSNKVQALDGGSWYALDGQPLHQAVVTASERYNTRLETLLRDRVGVRFAEVPHPQGRRPIREIVGIDTGLMAAWSRRRAAIDVKRAELAAAFTTAHGRPPSTVEALRLAQQATLDTREAKHEPRSLAEQRDTWRDEAITVLGGPNRLRAMLDAALPHDTDAAGSPTPTGRGNTPTERGNMPTDQMRELAAEVVERVAAGRAHWQETHLIAEAERLARSLDLTTQETEALVPRLVIAALQQCVRLTPPDRTRDPMIARRRDGTSMYTRAHSTRYTSQQVLDAERAVLAAADRTDGRTVTAIAVAAAVAQAAAEQGLALNPGQVTLVHDLATSGARVQLAMAPAGAGKTTAMTALAAAWTSRGGTVLSLGPSAVAAAELGAATGTTARTLAEVIYHAGRPDPPAWLTDIGPGTLIVVDEAGMAATADLATVTRIALERGASVRLIGDDRQLAAIGAGGLLRDLASRYPERVAALTEVVRFTDPAEAAATLALREGDIDALGFYLDHDRVHDVDQAVVADTVLAAWAGDLAAGKTSLMMASNLDTVTALNAAARAHRLTQNPPTDSDNAREVGLRSGLAASAGDTIITRRNDRSLRITGTDFVKNGDRHTILHVQDDGSALVRHHGSGHTVTLPADYVTGHVDLGYACTIHTAQGQTVDTAHLALTGSDDRQGLYVALTRGRQANHVYLSPAGDGDPHAVIHPDTVRPPTAVDILHRVVTRDAAQTSATTSLATAADPTELLAASAAKYADAVALVATTHLGGDWLARLARDADQVVPGLSECPAWPTLAGHLAAITLAGDDPIVALAEAVSHKGLGDARDVAAVLDYRLDPTGHHSAGPGPLPWLGGIPTQLADTPHAHWLHALSDLVAEDATAITDTARAWTAETAPAWAWGLLDRPELVADLAVWRAAAQIPEDAHTTGSQRTGPAHPVLAARAWQRGLNRRVTAALTAPPSGPWRAALRGWQPAVLDDPWYPVLAARLDLALLAGRDVHTLLDQARQAGPLPDEHPAAALWYRIAPDLGPITRHTTTTHLRPAWTTHLVDRLGATVAERIAHDPAWPTLVAAVHHASAETGATPVGLVDTALDLTGPIDTPDGIPLHLAAAVISWRVTDLTTPPDTGDDHVSEHDIDLTPDDYTPIHHADTVSGHTDSSEYPPDPLEPPHEDDPPPPPDPYTAASDDADSRVLVAEGGTSLDRILELTRAAGSYYTSAYVGSPAADYLTQRLGTDLTDRPEWVVGYAPPGWTHLVDHLRTTMGATDTELVDAGLGKWTRNHRLIDVFRDRLLFGLHDHDGHLVGFTGRAAPSAGPEVPKYLNSPTTIAYRKSHILFGCHETRHAPEAMPVLVEGPLDAIAVTLAGNGHHAGLATCGTALTPDHVATLVDRARHDWRTGPTVLVGPDTDPAGITAARTAHELLTDAGITPLWLSYRDVKDAADAHQKGTLVESLDDPTPPLARLLLQDYLDTHADALAKGWIEPRVRLHQEAARVLAAQPSCAHWNTIVRSVTESVPAPADSRDQNDEHDHLAASLYRASLARRIGWNEQHPPSTPMAAHRYSSALAALQTELDLDPDAAPTQGPRMQAVGDLTEAINNVQTSDAAASSTERRQHIRTVIDTAPPPQTSPEQWMTHPNTAPRTQRPPSPPF